MEKSCGDDGDADEIECVRGKSAAWSVWRCKNPKLSERHKLKVPMNE